MFRLNFLQGFLICFLPYTVCAQQDNYLRLDSLPKLKHQNFVYFDSTFRADTAVILQNIGKTVAYTNLMHTTGDKDDLYRVVDIFDNSPRTLYELDINRDKKPDYILNNEKDVGSYKFSISVVLLSTGKEYKIAFTNIGFFQGYYLQHDSIMLLTQNPLCCLDFWNKLAEYKLQDDSLVCISKSYFLYNSLFYTNWSRMAYPPIESLNPIGEIEIKKKQLFWFPIAEDSIYGITGDQKYYYANGKAKAKLICHTQNAYGPWTLVLVSGKHLRHYEKEVHEAIRDDTDYYLWLKGIRK